MIRTLRRGPLRALLLLVQVVVLACQLVEGTGHEHCAHHDMGAATPVMAMDHGHDAHHGSDAGHTCRCLGDCHATLAALPATVVSALPEGRIARHDAPLTALPVFATPQLRLPPAIGPPLSA